MGWAHGGPRRRPPSTNSELHRAMNLHVGNLRLLSGPLDQVRAACPSPALSPGEPPPCGAVWGGVGGSGPTASLLPEDRAVPEPEAHPGQGAEMRTSVCPWSSSCESLSRRTTSAALVTADHSEMKVGWVRAAGWLGTLPQRQGPEPVFLTPPQKLFEEQLKKYDQLRVYWREPGRPGQRPSGPD